MRPLSCARRSSRNPSTPPADASTDRAERLSTPAVRALRVDAQMPEHRHGMNYRARVSTTGERRYVAEGLLFHMPGRWQLVFDVERETGTERLTTDLVID